VKQSRDIADKDPGAVESVRSACIYVTVASVAIASALVIGAGIAVDPDGAPEVAFLVATAMAVAGLCRSHRRFLRLGDCLGAFGQMLIGGLASGVIAIMGLHAHWPLADQALLAADHAIGVNGLKIVDWLAAQPAWVLSTLSAAYFSTIPLLYLSIVALAILGDRPEVWRATFCFLGTVVTTCLISVVTPAKGLGIWASPELIRRLPERSIRHFWPAFERFYDGSNPVLQLNSIGGVVSFPSFHTIMGLILAAMWRKHPLIFIPAVGYFLVMLVATLPFGGHYFVDLVAGAGVWTVWFTLSLRVERGWASFDRLRRLRVAIEEA
jgi:membrane-associated phospholipid phosphatase